MARPEGADSAATFEKIRSAALKLVQAEGAAGLSVRRVAKEAGVGVGTLRYYFATQEALVEGCLDYYHERLAGLEATMSEHIRTSPDPRSAVADAVRATYALLSLHPELHRLRIMKSVQHGELAEQRRTHVRAPFMRSMVPMLSERSTKPPEHIRLALDSIIRLIAWYAVCSDDEVCDVTGQDRPEAAREALREHSAALTVTLLFGDDSD